MITAYLSRLFNASINVYHNVAYITVSTILDFKWTIKYSDIDNIDLYTVVDD